MPTNYRSRKENPLLKKTKSVPIYDTVVLGSYHQKDARSTTLSAGSSVCEPAPMRPAGTRKCRVKLRL